MKLNFLKVAKKINSNQTVLFLVTQNVLIVRTIRFSLIPAQALVTFQNASTSIRIPPCAAPPNISKTVLAIAVSFAKAAPHHQTLQTVRQIPKMNLKLME
jgi:hypothetical protein